MLHLLIKPASGLCNLRCRYCFYRDIAEHRSQKSFGIMSEATLENVIGKALSHSKRQCTFSYQGGEPTLAGLDFFKKAAQLQKKYNVNRVLIYNSLQTNGILLDGDWAAFLKENNYMVGLSLDGPKEQHDSCRVGPDNKESFGRVIKAAELLKRHGVEFNILTVVNGANVRNAQKLYRFFKNQEFSYIQFIPCINPLDGSKHVFSLRPGAYGEFLKKMFDMWYEDVLSGRGISIRQFDNYVGMLMGYPPESCGMSGTCSPQNVVEADGGVYPCDFYVLDPYKLGNLNECDFDEIESARGGSGFLAEEGIHSSCLACEFMFICRGGCKRYKTDGKYILCDDYKAFFAYTLPRMKQLAKYFQNI